MTDTHFTELRLLPQLIDAVGREGYTVPTEIQAKAIPILLSGRDILGTAQTGTGKTAAFVLPMLHRLTERPDSGPSPGPLSGRRLHGRPRPQRPAMPEALILAPTRELAIQIDESVGRYGAFLRIRHQAVYGGAPKPSQERLLAGMPRVVVATPGRLLDFIGEGKIVLANVAYLVLDEADRMLDMGFIPDVRRIVGMTPADRQTALFSATMPGPVAELAESVLRRPERVVCEHGSLRVETIEHSVLFVEQANKTKLLVELIERRAMSRAIVFTRTKHRASRVAKALAHERIPSDAIHGDKTQSARRRALEDFRSGRIRVLVATDVASRGLDVDDISHVVNFEIPAEPEAYVHRIGRTGRAGAAGAALSLCDAAEVTSLRAIERLLRIPVRVERDHAYHVEIAPPAPPRPLTGGRRPRHAGSRPQARRERPAARRPLAS